MVRNTYANGHSTDQGSTEANGSVHVGGDQYLPRSILITGGAGFIASHVVTQLLDSHPQYKVRGWLINARYLQPESLKDSRLDLLGLQIVVLDKLDYCASLRNLRSTQDKPNFKVSVRAFEFEQAVQYGKGLSGWQQRDCTLQFVKGDIQSADLVRHIFDQEEIDTVMHFAAQVNLQVVSGARFRLIMFHLAINQPLSADSRGQLLWQQSGFHNEQHLWHPCAVGVCTDLWQNQTFHQCQHR